MRNYTDKELANFILERRQHDGEAPSWGRFKKHKANWVLFITIILLLFGIGVFAQSWGWCGFVFGLVVGIFYRDRTWIEQQRQTWPFFVKITDWLKVEKIANGETTS